jgi:L-asparaginase II
MLLLAAYRKLPLETYWEAGHAVQQAMLAKVCELCEVEAGQVAVGVDGCGVPTFGLTLAGMALGFARLGQPEHDTRAYRRRIVEAMLSYPVMVSGTGTLATEIITQCNGKVVAKTGAEGLFAMTIPEQKIGILIKAEDGSFRPLGPVAVALLKWLGVLDQDQEAKLKRFASPPVKTTAGETVGCLELGFSF